MILSPDTFTGTAAATLHTDLGDDDHPVDIDLTRSFDHTTFHVDGHLEMGDVSLGGDPAPAWLGGLTLDAGFDGDIAAGTLSGGVTVAADVVVLDPQPAAGGEEPEGVARAGA
ncbi:MAG: hypothetical protein M5U19_07365 [Microthrixaceae bacterium]|nr:hypothetical protein [Microthrixaceae bacterium]